MGCDTLGHLSDQSQEILSVHCHHIGGHVARRSKVCDQLKQLFSRSCGQERSIFLSHVCNPLSVVVCYVSIIHISADLSTPLHPNSGIF